MLRKPLKTAWDILSHVDTALSWVGGGVFAGWSAVVGIMSGWLAYVEQFPLSISVLIGLACCAFMAWVFHYVKKSYPAYTEQNTQLEAQSVARQITGAPIELPNVSLQCQMNYYRNEITRDSRICQLTDKLIGPFYAPDNEYLNRFLSNGGHIGKCYLRNHSQTPIYQLKLYVRIVYWDKANRDGSVDPCKEWVVALPIEERLEGNSEIIFYVKNDTSYLLLEVYFSDQIVGHFAGSNDELSIPCVHEALGCNPMPLFGRRTNGDR